MSVLGQFNMGRVCIESVYYGPCLYSVSLIWAMSVFSRSVIWTVSVLSMSNINHSLRDLKIDFVYFHRSLNDLEIDFVYFINENVIVRKYMTFISRLMYLQDVR